MHCKTCPASVMLEEDNTSLRDILDLTVADIEFVSINH